jgi:hypothetical protein
MQPTSQFGRKLEAVVVPVPDKLGGTCATLDEFLEVAARLVPEDLRHAATSMDDLDSPALAVGRVAVFHVPAHLRGVSTERDPIQKLSDSLVAPLGALGAVALGKGNTPRTTSESALDVAERPEARPSRRRLLKLATGVGASALGLAAFGRLDQRSASAWACNCYVGLRYNPCDYNYRCPTNGYAYRKAVFKVYRDERECATECSVVYWSTVCC